jgi:hypothetical protein
MQRLLMIDDDARLAAMVTTSGATVPIRSKSSRTATPPLPGSGSVYGVTLPIDKRAPR